LILVQSSKAQSEWSNIVYDNGSKRCRAFHYLLFYSSSTPRQCSWQTFHWLGHHQGHHCHLIESSLHLYHPTTTDCHQLMRWALGNGRRRCRFHDVWNVWMSDAVCLLMLGEAYSNGETEVRETITTVSKEGQGKGKWDVHCCLLQM